MRNILFTDTHFGVKQNSITWLTSQLDFINKQLIPYIQKQKEDIRLIHLGDVFDSRSSVSIFHAQKVYNTFKKLSEITKEFIIIGGNHDYYSPLSDEVDSINVLLGSLNIKIITKDIYIDDDNNYYVPWYKWFEINNKEQNKILLDKGVKRIFTHADIVASPVLLTMDIYSGHTHIPYIKHNIFNLGSCYPLTFADANGDRGFYNLSDDNELKFIKNKYCISFKRLYNDDIFNYLDISKNDYVEVYMSQKNLQSHKHITRINELTDKLRNIWIIPQANINESQDTIESFEEYDIEDVTNQLIPKHLKDKFEQIKNSL